MSKRSGLLLCVIYHLILHCLAVTYSDTALDRSIRSEKQVIVFGGLFPVHKNEDNLCGDILDLGVQRLEAMVFATQLINQSPQLLPGVNVGFEIRDTCVQPNLALEESLSFVRDRGSRNGTTTGISGVVGAASSGISIVVANLLRLFSVPQISYASTAKILSDKTRFDYFFRTVPPDSLQAQAMAAIIDNFNWTYVHAIYSDDAYGSEGIEAFLNEIVQENKSRICIASTTGIPNGVTSESVYDDAVQKLDQVWAANSSVVVLFGQLSTATGVLTAMKKRSTFDPGFAEKFTWIGSDAWGDQLPSEFHSVARGMISVSPKASLSSGFDQYFMSLNPANYTANPWFREYWEVYFNCSFNSGNIALQLCNPTQEVISAETGYRQNSKVTFTIDAVYAFAYAVHNMIISLCPNSQLCSDIVDTRSGGEAVQGELLLEYLKNVSFPGMSAERIQFDSSGDEQGDFVIKNLKISPTDPSKHFYDTVGSWSPITFLSLEGEMEWNDQSEDVPVSICSLPCGGGEYPEPISDQSDCCWLCRPCLGDVLVSTGQQCSECPVGFKPNVDKTECIVIVPDFLKWSNVWSVVMIILSLFGLFLTGLVSVVLLHCRGHPLVKASSRELSVTILCGLGICYILPFIFIAKPSIPVCTLRRFGVGFAFSVCYSALLVKVNRIHRIFKRAQSSLQKPPLISPQSQMFFTFLLVCVQIAIGLVWLIVDYPMVAVRYDDFQAELVCRGSPIVGIFVYLGYSLVLLGLSMIYGLLSRKIPQAFNETKLILFTLFSTCILWVGLIPAYFGTGIIGSIYQTISLILGIILNATTMLSIMFMSKVYFLVSEKRKERKARNAMQRACSNHGGSITERRKRKYSMDLLGELLHACFKQ